MYSLLTYIWVVLGVNVGKYTIYRYHTLSIWERGKKNRDEQKRGGGDSKIFWNFHPGMFGERIQFDEHIFWDGSVQPPTRKRPVKHDDVCG